MSCLLKGNMYKMYIRTAALYGEKIPLDSNPKYLGVTLDRNFNFNHHTDIIRLNCLKLLNISLKPFVQIMVRQLAVYKTLIRFIYPL